HRDVVGAVSEREIEPAAARPARESEGAAGQTARLGEQPAAAVASDRRVLDPEALTQPERLRKVARRDLDLVAATLQVADDRAHHEHVRGVGEVDPDLHLAATLS